MIVVTGAVAGGVIAALVKDDPPRPAAIVVAVVDRGAVTLDVATTGTVEPATVRSLSFPVAGTVEAVKVRAGNRVSKGQTLAALDDTEAAGDVNAAAAALAAAQAELGEARTVAARATASATTCAQTGAALAGGAIAGDALAGGAIAGDALAGGAIAGDALAADVPAGDVRAGDARPAGAAGPCVTMGYPDSGGDPLLTAEQQVNRAARAVEVARKALDGTSLTAPIAGTVVAVEGKVGDQIRGGSTFISLADTYAMQVRAEFPEADAGALAGGQSATVALADADDVYEAQVIQVDPAGTSDGTLVRYGVRLAFADAPDGLLVGQSAQVRVRTGEVADALRVPSTAVHDVSGGSGTVLVRAADRSTERVVAVGLRGDRYTEITGGLEQGEQVVRSW
ncbi:HlyD family efflux transporter periplasmic adaptor subunit [Actinoplanes sp. NPDC023801]|uniref:efflux RND transporter periplasmic adaptor subunit n=1 Tax=Actinoplanes sp. NPDC023801 TaxID=3154595 RepID=UPI003406BC41